MVQYRARAPKPVRHPSLPSFPPSPLFPDSLPPSAHLAASLTAPTTPSRTKPSAKKPTSSSGVTSMTASSRRSPCPLLGGRTTSRSRGVRSRPVWRRGRRFPSACSFLLLPCRRPQFLSTDDERWGSCHLLYRSFADTSASSAFKAKNSTSSQSVSAPSARSSSRRFRSWSTTRDRRTRGRS